MLNSFAPRIYLRLGPTDIRKSLDTRRPGAGAFAGRPAVRRLVRVSREAREPFAIWRKIWLFFGIDDGGRRLAILSSFTGTCRQFDVNRWTWLKETLTRIAVTPTDLLGTLLPPRS